MNKKIRKVFIIRRQMKGGRERKEWYVTQGHLLNVVTRHQEEFSLRYFSYQEFNVFTKSKVSVVPPLSRGTLSCRVEKGQKILVVGTVTGGVS